MSGSTLPSATRRRLLDRILRQQSAAQAGSSFQYANSRSTAAGQFVQHSSRTIDHDLSMQMIGMGLESERAFWSGAAGPRGRFLQVPPAWNDENAAGGSDFTNSLPRVHRARWSDPGTAKVGETDGTSVS